MTTPHPNPSNHYHIDRFDSLSTCNTDHLSLFDELQQRRRSSNNQTLDPVIEMDPPPPPTSNSTFYHNQKSQLNSKQPLHLQLSNSSTTSQTSDYAPSSAPIINGDQPHSPNGDEFELLNQQNLFSGNHHRPLSKMRSVSFKKPKKMAFPKPPGDGYVNPAYQDDEGLEDDQELMEKEGDGDQDSNFLQIPTKSQKYNPLHTTDPDQMFTSFEHPEHMEVQLRSPSKHLSQYSTAEETPAPPPANYDDDKEWDRFETLPPPDDDETVDSEWVKISIQWLKIAAYVFTFFCVLAFAVLSKAATLLMTSMIAVNHSVAVCNSDRSFIIHEELQHDKIYKVQYGAEHLSRIAWIWCLYFAIVAPYVFAWLRALRICYFKSAKICSLATLATVFTFESLHCIGLSILMFLILPYVDVSKGAMMMNNVAVVPALIRLFVTSAPVLTKENSKAKTRKAMGLSTNRIITGATLAMQLLSVVLWTLIGYNERHSVERWYLIPVALILVSFEWWENYLIPQRMHRYLAFLEAARRDLEENKSRYFVSCFTMLWKALLIFGLMVLNEFSFNSHEVATMMFRNFTDAFHSPTVPVTRVKMDGIVMESEHHLLYVDLALWPLFVLIGHIAVTYLCYAFGKFTCKVCIQEISFAIPVTIAVPVTVSLLWALKNLEIQDKCQLSGRFHPFQYIFWNMGTMNSLGSFQYTSSYEDGHGWLNILVSVLWFLCLCSQIAATLHIWKETSERLASTELLFVNPMYNAVLIDQSLAMNRRSIKIVFDGEKEEEETEEEKAAKAKAKKLSLQAAAAAGDEEAIRAFSRAEELKKEEESKLYTGGGIPGTFDQRKKSAQDSDFEGASMNFADEHDYAQEWAELCASQGYDVDGIDPKCDPKDDDTVRIYACATMWHEDKNEMLQMLKAIMRLDKDQWAQAKAKEDFGAEESQYYEIETNIFFDDAYEQGLTDAQDDRVVNRFVEQLIDVMNEAANHVHEQNIIIDYPTIVPTPYGGKLIWKLPGGNRLIAHVKDKDLIRHRKRWSQCMYMYYLLGYRLAARADLSEQRKRKIANNTFVLALDGDINFQPVAVHMVVDLMKKNNKLGAACGRIHPIGGGPIVWYQKFEYAIGHWLQKATEHVFGCVLCSPGCFSLFRARAVMDKSVMNKYTTKPSEALHYVQYDQGEDRWLCTLMLQRGWRIEYCAASDSYTHAPEGFGEFYTQRRRWAPSTMANILDLLGDYKQTVDRNENISLLYILYQAFLMVGTVLSPGTIFLMVVSAMNSAMNLDSKTSLLCNVIPVLAFTFVCLKFKDNNIKINFAMLLSLIYALLMLAVMVGIGIDMYQQGILSPNALFFSCMMGSFLVAAIIHPQEFSCVLPLPLYMLLIPSMYMLLTIYSVTNMHIVAWGTREVKSKLSAKEVAAQKAEEEAKAKAAAEAASKKSLFSQYLDVSKYGAGGGKNGLFTCMCCSGGQHTTDNSGTIAEIAKNVTEMKVVVDQIRSQGGFVPGMSRRASLLTNSMPPSGAETPLEGTDSGQNSLSPVEEASKEGSEVDDTTDSLNQAVENRKTTNPIPKWIRTNKRLSTFQIKPLHDRELHFWRAMIDKYLLPLIENPAEKERISNELIDLRNKSVFAFAFMNIIFILFVFMLQLHKDVFGIDIPVGIAGYNRTYNEEENTWHVETIVNKTRMDPITLCLVVFFGAILIIQIIGMFIHRFGTLAQLLAYTKLNFFRKNEGELATIEWVKRMTAMAPAKRLTVRKGKDGNVTNNDGTDGEETPPDGSLRDTVRSRKSAKVPFKLDNVYEKRMTRLETDAKQVERLPSLMRKNTKRAISSRTMKKKTSFGSIDRSDTISSQDINFSLTSGMSVGGAGGGGGGGTSSAFNRQSMPPRPTLESMKSYPPTSSAGGAGGGGGGGDQPNSGKISALRERSRSANQGPIVERHNAPTMDTILESSRL